MLSRQVRTLVSRTATQRSTITPPSRAYASVASTQDTKPPVAVYGIDGTYASALVTQSSQTESKSQASSSAPSYLQYEILTNLVHLQYTAAAKTSSLETTARALTTLADVFKKDPKLLGILGAPTLTPSDKSQIVQELLRHMGNVEKGDTVKNFMKTLANNNRLGILEGVCEKFAVLIGAAKGELELVVQSASVSNLSQRSEKSNGNLAKWAHYGTIFANNCWGAET